MKKVDVIPFLIVAALFLIAFYIYPSLPTEIPTHWNAAGEVDDYSSRPTIFIFPVIILLIALLMHFLPKLAVFRKNVEQFKHFTGMKIALVSFFAVFFLMTLLPNFGYEFNMSTIIFLVIGFLFIYLGYIIKDVKRNFWIGIRTPWTLSDDVVWKKTHKIGSKLFIFAGIIFLVTSFLKEYNILIILVLVFGVVGYTYCYSFIQYKRRHR